MGLHEKALDKIDEVICLVDENLKLVFVNKAIEKFGIKRKDAIGKDVREAISFLPENFYHRVFSGSTVKRKKWISRNGKNFYIAIESSMLENNVAITVIKDITEYKTMEDRIKEFKKLYEKILDASNEGIYIEDGEGTIIFANAAFSNMIGYSKREIVGKRFPELIPDYETKRIGNKKYEIKFYTKNGHHKVILSSYHILSPENGLAGKINFNLDITEVKEMEEKIKVLSERERNFRLKTAHYFFNPLAIAKGYMGLMAEEVGENEREKVMKAIHAISRVENVIKNLVTRGEIAE